MGAVRKLKNVEWERNRRDKLNSTFLELSQLLPDHDPSLSLSKVEILRKTLAYILELRDSNTQLLETNCDSVLKQEMAELRRQLSDQRKRNRQLLDLLRIAEITVTGPPPPNPNMLFSPPRKWRGRITQPPKDTGKKEEKKCNIKPTAKIKCAKMKNKKMITKQQTIKTRSKTFSEKNSGGAASNIVVEVPENCQSTKISTPLKEINNSVNSSSLFPRTITVPCTTVSLVLSSAKTSIVTVAQSGLLASPIMATGIQPVLSRNVGISTLGPGTLIMSDGRVVTVPPVLAATPQIIVNRPQTQPAVIVMQNIGTVKPPPPQQRPIVPKLKQDSTRTTFVNKVPISAIRVGRSKHKKENNKKTVSGKSVEEKTGTIKKLESKTVIVELVKENRPATKKQKNENTTVEKGAANKSTIITSNKSSQIIRDKKTQSGVNSNSVKRKDLKDKNIELVKRKKVSDKIVGIDNVSEVVSVPKSSVTDSSQLAINNNSTSQILAPTDISKENPSSKQTTRIATGTLTSEKDVPGSSENKNAYNKNGTEILLNNDFSAANSSVQLNCEGAIPVNAATKFNTGDSQSIQNPSDSRVVSSAYNPQTQRIAQEKNIISNSNATKSTPDNNINTTLTMRNKGKCIEDNNDLQRTSASNENIANNRDSLLDNHCLETGSVFNKENSKRLMTQNCKATQITAEQLKYRENPETTFENKTDKTITTNKTDIGAKKNSPEKTIPDVSQDLTSLFPIDPKLQVCPDNIFRDTDFRDRNLFMPISHSYMDEVRLSLPHSDFSNDLFSSLQVPAGAQHPESISPTAAFLMAFPLVSTSKTSEMIAENEAGESQHATPTTILQIGNIDPPSDLYQQTALMIDNNITDLHDPMKLNKASSNNKNNTKQMKRVEPFQQIHMNDLLHTDNISRSNCKDKKSFPAVQEHNIYLPCNKKKAVGRNCDYPLPNEIITNFQEKPYEFPPTNNPSLSGVQNLPNNNRQLSSGSNQKKPQPRTDIMADHQNPCPASSQSFSYNAFPSGSDFSFPSSSYIPTNQSTPQQIPKPAQTLSNFTSSWSTSSITSTSNCVDYSSPYCSYPQKSYTNTANNKSVTQKLNHNNYDDSRLKEKTPSSTTLPKFSTNFQFNTNNQPNLSNQVYPNTNVPDIGNYKMDPKTKKQKIGNDSQRAPVNWMTTPDVRPVLPDSNIAPDVLFPPQKEVDFNSSGNNMFSTSNNITPFNISSTVANNSQTLYPNSHFSGIDFQLDFAPFPEITSSKSSKAINTSSSNQFSWSPNKSSLSLLPHIDSHMIPSTLPTLVGDLALGTTTPSGPIDTFRNLNMPTTPFIVDNPNKKCESKSDPQKTSVNKLPDKDCFPNSERRNGNKNITEFCQKTHSHQSTNTTSSFLSVSQLVDPVKSEQVTSRRSVKQTVVSSTKTSSSVQKRNINHQTEKLNHSKITSNISAVNHSNNYHFNLPNSAISNQHQRKPDTFQNNQTNSGYPNMFANNFNPAPWQNSKTSRTSNFKGGSYSAESLIGEQHPQNPVPELPPFSIANQYSNNQKPFMDTPIVSSAAYSGTDFSHQNVQSLDFQTTQHTNQNCFNFPAHNTHYSEDYHNIGLDSMYSMSHPPSKSVQMDSKTVHKRNPPKHRREEIAGSQQVQYFPRDGSSSRGIKCPSPSHHGTSSVTNFNLSTIFPEINDKRVVQGTNSYQSITSKLNDSSTGRPGHRADFPATNFNPQMQQVGQPAPPVSFANVGQPAINFRPQ